MQAKSNQNVQGMPDELQAKGIFIVEVLRDGKSGPEVLQRRVSPNLIVNTGKRQIWRVASGLSATTFDQMRIGTSAVAANSAQTNVLSPVTKSINTVDSKTLLAGTRTMQWVMSYPSGAATTTGGVLSAANIREVVILNQNTSPGGSALSRSVFTAVNKTKSDKLRITYRARVT
jgi:hypothetical protein